VRGAEKLREVGLIPDQAGSRSGVPQVPRGRPGGLPGRVLFPRPGNFPVGLPPQSTAQVQGSAVVRASNLGMCT